MIPLIERLKTALELIRKYEEGSGITVELTQSEIKSMLMVYSSDRSKPEIQESLAELEAQGWKWWAEYEPEMVSWCAVICFHNGGMPTWKNDLPQYYFPTKSEAEEACVEYLLNLNTEE